MILYATQKTYDRYKIRDIEEMREPMTSMSKMLIAAEGGDRFLEWGVKLFYFTGRKCLLLTNFETKLTVLLADFKVDSLIDIGNWLAMYLTKLYEDDEEATKCLELLFEEHPAVCFSKLKDKSTISTLNHLLTFDMDEGNRLFDYIEENILKTNKFVHDVNFEWLFGYKNEKGKYDYDYSGVRFREALVKRYGDRVKEKEKLPPIGSPFNLSKKNFSC